MTIARRRSSTGRREANALPLLRTAYNVTIRSACTKENLALAVHDAGSAAARGETAKTRCLDEGCNAQTPTITFVPLGLDTTGAAGPSTLQTLRILARQGSWHSEFSDADACT